MKILMTSETYLPRIGGAEIHVKNLFERLVRAGHDVHLITNEVGEGEDIVTRISWSRKNAFKLVRAVWQCSKNTHIIHTHYCHRLAFIAGIIGRLRRVPVIITLHGMGILDHPGAPFRARLSHSFYRYWSLQLCTYVISTSEDLASVADKYISRKKMGVILNGYDADLFSPRQVEKVIDGKDFTAKKIILTVRRLVPKNGLHYLIEALPYILDKVPSAHYILAGDGALRTHIEKRVKELSLENNVTLLGMVDNSKVFNYIASADVLVFPSTAESSSIACAEAMGMRKRIVASRVGGLVELLGKNEERGYLVNLVPWSGSNYNAPMTLPDSSYQNLANGVVSALVNAEESDKKSHAAEVFAKRELSWDAIYNKTTDVYNELLELKI